jgi:hypothetical protein
LGSGGPIGADAPAVADDKDDRFFHGRMEEYKGNDGAKSKNCDGLGSAQFCGVNSSVVHRGKRRAFQGQRSVSPPWGVT